MIPTLLLEHKMHVRRPPRMSFQELEQLSYWPIMRNRIADRHDRVEPESAFLIARHDTAPIGAIVLRILYIVVPAAVRLPDVDFDALDRRPGRVFDGAEHKAGLAFGVRRDVAAGGDDLGFVAVEWPEDGTFGAGGGLRVVDCVNEEREAEDVGEEDEFLSCRVRLHSAKENEGWERDLHVGHRC